MSDIVEIKTELMSVSAQDVEALSKHLKAIKSFVSGELKNGIDKDYAIVPGTNKKSLLKPGAEKLMKLFGFSSRVECIEKTVSPEENFAMFTYKASIIHIKSGAIVADCEGICNSMEKKYRNNQFMDILNTIMKMSQKRALVGAVILATGASDYFTQDEDEIQTQNENRNKLVDDSKFKDVAPSSDLGSYTVLVGKHKGKTLNEVGEKDLSSYLNWMSENRENPTGPMLELLNKGREFLRMGA